MSDDNMQLRLDDETLEMITDFKYYQGDESYSIHLAYKIVALFDEQFVDDSEDE